MAEYLGGKTTTYRDEFEERKKYKEQITQKLSRGQYVDTLYTNPNYGLLNHKYQPVVPLVDNADSNMKPFEGYAEDIKASTFMVDAYNEFRQFYQQYMNDTQIGLPDFLDPTLAPVKGYESVDVLYDDYKAYMVEFFVQDLLEQQFVDFHTFEPHFLRSLMRNIEAFPLTRSGFILSSHCPISISGFSIELATLQYNEDEPKADLFQDERFYCFVENCSNFGLMVDKNAPWRLYLNLDSQPAIDKIMQWQSNCGDHNIILDHFYWTKTHYDDITDIKELTNLIYNELARLRPVVSVTVVDPNTGLNSTTDTIVDPNIDNSILSDKEYWIRLLWRVRAREVRLKKEKTDRLEEDIVEFHNLRGNDWVFETETLDSRNRPFKAVSGKIGDLCAKQLKKFYEMHHNIDSNKSTWLSSYREDLRETADPDTPTATAEEARATPRMEIIYRGQTSVNSLHSHDYELDYYGNGWTSEAAHPETPFIKHRHRVVAWVVQLSGSSCYPNCYEQYGHAGSPIHPHFINKENHEE